MFYEVTPSIRNLNSSNELEILEIEDNSRRKILYEVSPPSTKRLKKYNSNEIIIEEEPQIDVHMESPIFLAPKKKEQKPINNIFIRMEMPKPETSENTQNPDYESLSKKIDKIVEQVVKPNQFNPNSTVSRRIIKQEFGESDETVSTKGYNYLNKKIDRILEHVVKSNGNGQNAAQSSKSSDDQILPKKSSRFKKNKDEPRKILSRNDSQSDQKIDKIESLDAELLDKFLSNKFDKIKRDSEVKKSLEPTPIPTLVPALSSHRMTLKNEIQIPDNETVNSLSLVKPTYLNVNENLFMPQLEYIQDSSRNPYENTEHISSKNRPVLLSLTIVASIIFLIQALLFSRYTSSYVQQQLALRRSKCKTNQSIGKLFLNQIDRKADFFGIVFDLKAVTTDTKGYKESCQNSNECFISLGLVCSDTKNECICSRNLFWSSVAKKCIECPKKINWFVDGNHCVYLNENHFDFVTVSSFCIENDANVIKLSEHEYGCLL